jgi:hypothetical protein
MMQASALQDGDNYCDPAWLERTRVGAILIERKDTSGNSRSASAAESHAAARSFDRFPRAME